MKVAKGQSFRSQLIRVNACGEAREWVGCKSLRAAYRTCGRGDWMLWLAARSGVDRKVVVLAACECARLALPHVRAGEDRPRATIEIAERWARGEAGVTPGDVREAAADAAYADAAYAAAAAYAAGAAYAADAAYAAADAASRSSAASGARAETLRLCADIVRKHVSVEMIAAALAAPGGSRE